MKLSCVVVWYNPESLDDPVANINSYAYKCDRIYIVDNSSNDNRDLADKVKNAVYIPMLCNKGIACALNIGCTKALEDSFEWCLTMDQDSVWEEEELDKYIKRIELKICEDEMIKSFAPYPKSPNIHSVLGKIRRTIFKNIKDKEDPTEDVYVDRCICSGNVINLKTYNEVGKFYEPFFIDEVDHEFCFRLLRNGYKIFQFNSVVLQHQLGDKEQRLFPSTQHSIVRNYYCIRNMLYVCDKYPKLAKKYDYKKAIWWLVKMNLKYSGIYVFRNLKFILKAFKDHKNNIYGEYNSAK